jgi:hypothetical protein
MPAYLPEATSEKVYRLRHFLQSPKVIRWLFLSGEPSSPAAFPSFPEILWHSPEVKHASYLNPIGKAQLFFGRCRTAIMPDASGGYGLNSHWLWRAGYRGGSPSTQYCGFPLHPIRVLFALAHGTDEALPAKSLHSSCGMKGCVNPAHFKVTPEALLQWEGFKEVEPSFVLGLHALEHKAAFLEILDEQGIPHPDADAWQDFVEPQLAYRSPGRVADAWAVEYTRRAALKRLHNPHLGDPFHTSDGAKLKGGLNLILAKDEN